MSRHRLDDPGRPRPSVPRHRAEIDPATVPIARAAPREPRRHQGRAGHRAVATPQAPALAVGVVATSVLVAWGANAEAAIAASGAHARSTPSVDHHPSSSKRPASKTTKAKHSGHPSSKRPSSSHKPSSSTPSSSTPSSSTPSSSTPSSSTPSSSTPSSSTPSSSTPSSAPAPTGPATQARNKAGNPGDVLDLNNWYLTLPTGAQGNPDTVHQPDLSRYSSNNFQLADTRDSVVFTADAGGATTSGSQYPRSELREMNGTAKASWSNTSGRHALRVRQAVLAVPAAKPDVVTAQIHDASSDVVEVRLEGTRLIAQYNDGKTDITLDPAYVLGAVYDLDLVAAGGRIEVDYNGQKKADIQQSGSGWYFKSGSYVQSNTSRGDSPDAVGTVAIYALDVTHTG